MSGGQRILIFHGYLLKGTGSNIYNANLARALTALGHEVHLLCQDGHAEELDFVSAVGEASADGIELREVRAALGNGSCTVYRPEIGSLLPVYVADKYEGFEARTFDLLSDVELEHYLESNIAAVRAVAAAAKPVLALANHEIMGPAILRRAFDGAGASRAGVPYAVKVHGSALEYIVEPFKDRFLAYAREGLQGAEAILVGSRHTAERLFAVLGDRGLERRTRLGPPGVDVERFAPRSKEQATSALQAQLTRRQLRGVVGGDDRLCAFVGKFIVSKGVELLLAAWPYVVAEHPQAKLLVIGFGAYEEGLKSLLRALAEGNYGELEWIVLRGRELEGGDPSRLDCLADFLQGLDGAERREYLDHASQLRDRVVFVGRLDHGELADVLPACELMVVPSTFPEAFGMVATEAAACGVWPIVAHHSGLAEVADTLAEQIPGEYRGLLSFELTGNAVRDLADRVNGWFGLSAPVRLELSGRVRHVAEASWSWQGVARGVVSAAQGKLDLLPSIRSDRLRKVD